MPQMYRSETRLCLVCSKPFRATADYKHKRQQYCSHRCYLLNRRVSLPERKVGEALSLAGVHLDPQKRIGRWTFDYYLPEAKIVVEVDGAFWHSSPEVQERDRRKDAFVEESGMMIVRIDADEVMINCLRAIDPVLSLWEKNTGQKATLEGDGRTFEEIDEHRYSRHGAAQNSSESYNLAIAEKRKEVASKKAAKR